MGIFDEPERKFKLDEAPTDVRPVCGHCKKELDTIWRRTNELGVADEQILICPHCRAVLGFGVQHM